MSTSDVTRILTEEFAEEDGGKIQDGRLLDLPKFAADLDIPSRL